MKLTRLLPSLGVAAAFGVAALLTTWTAVSAYAVPEGWTEDFSAAKQQAQQADKDLLLDFTGSDWCGWCIKLTDEVFSKDKFKQTVPDDFVLVYLDFPQNVPQSDAVKKQNAELQASFGIQGFPTIALADAQGRPYAMTGYQAGGAEAYIKHLEELQQIRVQRDEALSRAEKLEGLEKAKALDEALQTVGLELAVQHYQPLVEQIIKLDSSNEAGLKAQYESALAQAQVGGMMQEAMGLLQSNQLDAGLSKLDEALAVSTQPEPRQMILAVRGQVFMQQNKTAEARTAFEKAIAEAPNSQVAPQIQQLLNQLAAK